MNSKRDLYIIGASYFGRVVESWLEIIPESDRDWQIKGYLHTYDGESPLSGYPTDYKILGGWADYSLSKNDYCLIAVADCAWKEKVYRYLKGKISFYTYIAPNAVIGKFTSIGEGSIICPGCVLATNVKIGNCVTINNGTQLGHDVIIGDYSFIMGNVDLTGKVVVGSMVTVGAKAIVIPGVTIEDYGKVGAGSVVVKDVKSRTTVFGNPAKVIAI